MREEEEQQQREEDEEGEEEEQEHDEQEQQQQVHGREEQGGMTSMRSMRSMMSIRSMRSKSMKRRQGWSCDLMIPNTDMRMALRFMLHLPQTFLLNMRRFCDCLGPSHEPSKTDIISDHFVVCIDGGGHYDTTPLPTKRLLQHVLPVSTSDSLAWGTTRARRVRHCQHGRPLTTPAWQNTGRLDHCQPHDVLVSASAAATHVPPATLHTPSLDSPVQPLLQWKSTKQNLLTETFVAVALR